MVEYRGEDPRVPIKPLHKMTEAQVRREMAVHPLEYMNTKEELPRQHLMLFRKKALNAVAKPDFNTAAPTVP